MPPCTGCRPPEWLTREQIRANLESPHLRETRAGETVYSTALNGDWWGWHVREWGLGTAHPWLTPCWVDNPEWADQWRDGVPEDWRPEPSHATPWHPFVGDRVWWRNCAAEVRWGTVLEPSPPFPVVADADDHALVQPDPYMTEGGTRVTSTPVWMWLGDIQPNPGFTADVSISYSVDTSPVVVHVPGCILDEHHAGGCCLGDDIDYRTLAEDYEEPREQRAARFRAGAGSAEQVAAARLARRLERARARMARSAAATAREAEIERDTEAFVDALVGPPPQPGFCRFAAVNPEPCIGAAFRAGIVTWPTTGAEEIWSCRGHVQLAASYMQSAINSARQPRGPQAQWRIETQPLRLAGADYNPATATGRDLERMAEMTGTTRQLLDSAGPRAVVGLDGLPMESDAALRERRRREVEGITDETLYLPTLPPFRLRFRFDRQRGREPLDAVKARIVRSLQQMDRPLTLDAAGFRAIGEMALREGFGGVVEPVSVERMDTPAPPRPWYGPNDAPRQIAVLTDRGRMVYPGERIRIAAPVPPPRHRPGTGCFARAYMHEATPQTDEQRAEHARAAAEQRRALAGQAAPAVGAITAALVAGSLDVSTHGLPVDEPRPGRVPADRGIW